MKNVSAYLKKAYVKKNTFTQFPSKKWGFAGDVYKYLMFENKDGSKPTEEEMNDGLKKARTLGQRFSGLKPRVWDTPLDAFKEAKKFNQSIYVSEKLIEDNSQIEVALKKSGVDYEIYKVF